MTRVCPEDFDLNGDGVIDDAETWEDLVDRCMNAITGIVEKHEEKNVLVVAHGGVISSILTGITKSDEWTGKNKLKNVCINMLNYDKGNWDIEFLNKTAEELV